MWAGHSLRDANQSRRSQTAWLGSVKAGSLAWWVSGSTRLTLRADESCGQQEGIWCSEWNNTIISVQSCMEPCFSQDSSQSWAPLLTVSAESQDDSMARGLKPRLTLVVSPAQSWEGKRSRSVPSSHQRTLISSNRFLSQESRSSKEH